jgi:hypothetical protein
VIPAVDQDNDDDGDDVEGKESRMQRRKKDEYTLEVDTDGLPVIPDIEDINLESKKSLIRTFLTKHYSKFHTSGFRKSLSNNYVFSRVLQSKAKGVCSLVCSPGDSGRFYRVQIFTYRREDQRSIKTSVG